MGVFWVARDYHHKVTAAICVEYMQPATLTQWRNDKRDALLVEAATITLNQPLPTDARILQSGA